MAHPTSDRSRIRGWGASNLSKAWGKYTAVIEGEELVLWGAVVQPLIEAGVTLEVNRPSERLLSTSPNVCKCGVS